MCYFPFTISLKFVQYKYIYEKNSYTSFQTRGDQKFLLKSSETDLFKSFLFNCKRKCNFFLHIYIKNMFSPLHFLAVMFSRIWYHFDFCGINGKYCNATFGNNIQNHRLSKITQTRIFVTLIVY